MKLIHLSDLHLGKRVNEFPMLEDQRYVLTQILRIIDDEKPDGILIAGDIYEKSIPSAEAVQLFDDFLVHISQRVVQVFVISGNHDSPERIAFGGRLMNQSGVYMSPVYDGTVTPVTLVDEYGVVQIYMLPFLRPSHVKQYNPDEKIETYTDAIRIVVEHMATDTNVRNVLVTHQFVTGASRCDSEDIAVGGSDNVEASVFAPFDYVALGHIHNPQNVGGNTVRYCGTPLKYSFSEAGQEKSVTIVTLLEKGTVSIRTIPLIPKHDMRELRGTYAEITFRQFYDGTTYPNDYMHITLTDEEDIPDAIGKLRVIYPNLMKLDYDNKRTRSNTEILGVFDIAKRTPLEIFGAFYRRQNNQSMTMEQQAFVSTLMQKAWEDEV